MAASLAGDPPTVVVEGTRVEVDASSASVTVVDVDALPESSDLAAAVDVAPGAVVQRLGGLADWSAVSLRGSTVRQVLVTIDGVPLNPDGLSAVDLSELPLRAFSRVEVYRGAAPPELASSAMGGVVNLVTGDAGAPTTVTAAAGSWTTGRLHVSTAPTGRTARGFVSVDALTTQGGFPYLDDRGTIYVPSDDRVVDRVNDDARQLAAHARVQLGDHRLRVTLVDSAFVRVAGVPGPIGRPTGGVRSSTLRDVFVAQVDGGSDAVRGEGRLWGHVREDRLDDRAGELGVGADVTRDLVSAAGAHGSVRWRAVPGTTLAVTADARRDGWDGRDALAGSERHERLAASVAGSAAIRAFDERLALFPVLHAVWVQDAASAVTPRLGVLARPAPWLVAKANAGTYLRAPDFLELYGNGGAVVGSPDLRPERGWQVDVGARAALPARAGLSGNVEITHFWSGSRDLVVWVQNAQRTTFPVNLDRTWVQGVEGALWLDVGGRLTTRTNLTRTVSVNLSPEPAYANKRLPRIPAWELDHRTTLTAGRVRLSHGVSFASGAYWDATNWYPSAARLLHDASAELRTGDGFTVGVDVLNLGDRITGTGPRNPLDAGDAATIRRPITDFVGYPLPGRTVLGWIRWTAP